MNFTPKLSRKYKAHDWMDYLQESDGLREILAKTEDLAKLKGQIHSALTTLNLGHLSSKIESGWRSGSKDELFLLVNSASIASRLQQILPSLIEELSNSGLVCNTIIVLVKPEQLIWKVKARPAKREQLKGLNGAAKKSLESLLEKLEPESNLRLSIERLLKKAEVS